MGRVLTVLILSGLLAMLLLGTASAAGKASRYVGIQARGITRADFLQPGCSIRAIDTRQWLVRC
ncbi:hypothetical protein KDL29_01770 [bacterium]|nr:hypothetical protein [bacterium]MCB1220170.1 hypothetical protein [bacterium]UNM07023.1 MAG: hypothetical protein H7A35_09040 [Planctomycetales bacterium]